MVVDVFREGDKEDEERDIPIDPWFWDRKTTAVGEWDDDDGGDQDDDREDLAPDDVKERQLPEIPLHPMLATFDMRRHMRLRVHVACVEPYRYDETIATRLILPPDDRGLVEMLVAHNGVFRDVVAGKSGGAVILAAGPPGTGKTLTAEVYAEAMKRPLYSVQCSQLGVSPEELEEELLKVFVRSQRWNAILLLDEADVYVAARGNDLDQNAIVGVFLRTLEYYAGVLFLTTNRADAVDDAVASRCIARIDYRVPASEAQRRIWEVLSTTAGIAISDAVIDQAVGEFHDLTGRDIKNLLKLSRMVGAARNQPITIETIRWVKRFKPTGRASRSRFY